MNNGLWGALGLALCGLACSSELSDANGDGVADGVHEPNNVTLIAPSDPKGHVAGEVRDATTNLPLAGVRVTLFGPGFGPSADQMTDASGGFQFGPVPAGARFQLHLSSNGYTEATLSGLVIDDAAGNFPTENGGVFVGPIGLMPTTGRFAVHVVSVAGSGVPGAKVVIETAVAWFEDGVARGTSFATASTDADGRAVVTGLADVWALPPRNAAQSGLVIDVLPVDANGDGTPELRGAVLALAGEEVRALASPPVIVLDRPAGATPLMILASNVPGLVSGTPRPPPNPTILEPMDPIRLVFNQVVDVTSMLIVLNNEAGDAEVRATPVAGVLGNTVEITHSEAFAAGQEYNLAIRAVSFAAVPEQILSAAAPFFVRSDPATPIQIDGNFVDVDKDGTWGTGTDSLQLRLRIPLGRPGASPAFAARLWVGVDLNGSGVTGDAAGELPPPGAALPAPMMVNAEEPNPGNGAGASGYTRFVQAVALPLALPLTQLQGPIGYELQLNPADNGGQFVTDPGGRAAPPRLQANAPLVR